MATDHRELLRECMSMLSRYLNETQFEAQPHAIIFSAEKLLRRIDEALNEPVAQQVKTESGEAGGERRDIRAGTPGSVPAQASGIESSLPAVAAGPYIDRSDAVNLATNYLTFYSKDGINLTGIGATKLAKAVLAMDAYINALPQATGTAQPSHEGCGPDGGAPIEAHSKSQYKRLVAQGANVVAPTPETDAVADSGLGCDAWNKLIVFMVGGVL